MITENKKKALEELADLIAEAMSRVSAQKETDLCQYISDSDGRLHHFAYGKLKKKNPEALSKMVKEQIIDRDSPIKVASKKRVQYKKQRGVSVTLSRFQVAQLLNVLQSPDAEIQGADELITALTPHQTIKQVQKLIIDMVREKKVDMNLWDTYVKLVKKE